MIRIFLNNTGGLGFHQPTASYIAPALTLGLFQPTFAEASVGNVP